MTVCNIVSAKLRSCVKVEVPVLGFPTLICLMVSVDVKQQLKKNSIGLESTELRWTQNDDHILCESRGARPRLPDPNMPYGFCGRKATVEEEQYRPWKHRIEIHTKRRPHTFAYQAQASPAQIRPIIITALATSWEARTQPWGVGGWGGGTIICLRFVLTGLAASVDRCWDLVWAEVPWRVRSDYFTPPRIGLGHRSRLLYRCMQSDSLLWLTFFSVVTVSVTRWRVSGAEQEYSLSNARVEHDRHQMDGWPLCARSEPVWPSGKAFGW